MKNFLQPIYVALSILPSLFIVCFYSIVARSYFVLNRFPKFNDPIASFFPVHHSILFYLTTGVIFLCIPWIIITYIISRYRNKFSEKFINFNVIFYICSLFLLLFLAMFDPTTSWEWLLD